MTQLTPSEVSLSYLDGLTSLERHISSLKEDFIAYDLFSERNDELFVDYRKTYYQYLSSISKVLNNIINLFELNCKANNLIYKD